MAVNPSLRSIPYFAAAAIFSLFPPPAGFAFVPASLSPAMFGGAFLPLWAEERTIQIRRVSHAAIVGECERSRFMPSFPLHVNKRDFRIEVDDPDMPLFYALRDLLNLKGPRFGCGLS